MVVARSGALGPLSLLRVVRSVCGGAGTFVCLSDLALLLLSTRQQTAVGTRPPSSRHRSGIHLVHLLTFARAPSGPSRDVQSRRGRSAGSRAVESSSSSSPAPSPSPAAAQGNKRSAASGDDDDSNRTANDEMDDDERKAAARTKKRARVASPPPQQSAASSSTSALTPVSTPTLDRDTLGHALTFLQLSELPSAICASRRWLAVATSMKARGDHVVTRLLKLDQLTKSPLRRHVRSMRLCATEVVRLDEQRVSLIDSADSSLPLTPLARAAFEILFHHYANVEFVYWSNLRRMVINRADLCRLIRARKGATVSADQVWAIFQAGHIAGWADHQRMTIEGFCEWNRIRCLDADELKLAWEDLHAVGFGADLLPAVFPSAAELLQQLHATVPQLMSLQLSLGVATSLPTTEITLSPLLPKLTHLAVTFCIPAPPQACPSKEIICSVVRSCLEAVARCSALTTLHLSNLDQRGVLPWPMTPGILQPLVALAPTLTSISLLKPAGSVVWWLHNDEIDVIRALPNLTSIAAHEFLWMPEQLERFAAEPTPAAVTSLALRSVAFPPDHIAALQPLVTLTTLETSIESIDETFLPVLKRLESVYLACKNGLDSDRLISTLAQCPQLTSCTLEDHPGITDDDLARLLPSLVNLRHLALIDLELDSLECLTKAPHLTRTLRSLILCDCGDIPPEAVAPICSLQGLVSLTISWCGLLDAFARDLVNPSIMTVESSRPVKLTRYTRYNP